MNDFISFIDEHPWIMVAAFAALQLAFFIITNISLRKLRHYLPKDGWVSISQDNSFSLISNPNQFGATALVNELNDLIRKHSGAITFTVVKDRTERSVDSLHDYSLSMVSFPTYLGLMGTFLGIYVGLKSFNSGMLQGNGGITDEMVHQLIGGIIISMVTSLIGLFLMIVSNLRAGLIMKNLNRNKEVFYDFVQLDLITANRTNQLASMNFLGNTIKEFEPAFRKVIGEFQDSFRECTAMLKQTFVDNSVTINTAMNKMADNMLVIHSNLERQEAVLAALQQRELVNTLDRFVEAAQTFDSVTASIEKLDEAKERILISTQALVDCQNSYNQSLGIPKDLVEQVNLLLDRVNGFEESINGLGESITQTQLFRNNELELIQKQLDSLKDKTRIVTNIQEKTSTELEEIYNDYANSINDITIDFRNSLKTSLSDVNTAIEDFKASFKQLLGQSLTKPVTTNDATDSRITIEQLQAIEGSLSSINDSLNTLVYPPKKSKRKFSLFGRKKKS